jgi:hypothetical protein
VLNNKEHYNKKFFQPCLRTNEMDVEVKNHGLNENIKDESWRKQSEIDHVMEALNLMPDDPSIPLISYN